MTDIAEADLLPRRATPPTSPAAPLPPAGRGRRRRLLDVAYRTIDSPLGPLLLAATEQGLVRLAYEQEDHERVLQTWPPGSARGSCARPVGWTTRPPSSTTTSPARGTRSTCRWTCGWRRVPSAGAGPPADHRLRPDQSPTPLSRRRRAGRGRSGRSARPAPRTRCRSSCPATGCCVPTARWAATSAGWGPSARCSRWNARFRGGAWPPRTRLHCKLGNVQEAQPGSAHAGPSRERERRTA